MMNGPIRIFVFAFLAFVVSIKRTRQAPLSMDVRG